MCSVFRGGIDLAVLETVCAEAVDLRVPVLDALTELVDHSLLRRAAPARRRREFAMLETVREFAAEQLRELPEQEQVRAAHAAAFWALAKDLARPPSCPDRAGLDLLELEHDNFRAALDWYARGGSGHGAAAGQPAHRLLVRCAGTSPKAGGAWAICSNGSRTTTPSGWTRSAARRGSRPTRVTVPRQSPLLDESIARARAAAGPCPGGRRPVSTGAGPRDHR